MAYRIAGIFMAMLAVVSCKKNNIGAPQLTQGNVTDTILMGGGTKMLTFTSTAGWSIDTAGFGWLKLSQTSGGSGAATITLTGVANKSGASRSLLLILNAGNGQTRQITVWQDVIIYPSYNTSPIAADATGMSSTATQIANNIVYGWNFYNTMESARWRNRMGKSGNYPTTV